MKPAGSLHGLRALVTGASGFIGSRLCVRLLEEGADVHGVSRHERNGGDIRWTALDLRNSEALSDLFSEARPDLVFHLASYVSGSREADAVPATLEGNLMSAVNVLVAASKVDCGRVLLTGSLEEPAGEESEPVPVSPYAAAKFAAGAYGRMFHALYGVPVVNLRVFMVYGPGQRDETKLVPYVITSLLAGSPPMLSSGTRPVDWVYVDDVVDAFVTTAFDQRAVGETIDVGSGVLTPIREVVESIVRLMGSPVSPAFGALPDRPNERVRVADVQRSRDLVGWAPKTALTDGLADTIAWFSREAAGR